jgi:hypothetical protein
MLASKRMNREYLGISFPITVGILPETCVPKYPKLAGKVRNLGGVPLRTTFS